MTDGMYAEHEVCLKRVRIRQIYVRDYGVARIRPTVYNMKKAVYCEHKAEY